MATAGTGQRYHSFDEAPYDNSSTVFDRMTGLTWGMYTMGNAKSAADAQAQCANLTLPGGGKWRTPTLGEVRQVTWRDPRTAKGPWTTPFKNWYAGTYLATASVLDAQGKSMWHLNFPAGTTDWNAGAPAASVPCVSP